MTDTKQTSGDTMHDAPDDYQLTRFNDAVTDALMFVEGFKAGGGDYSGDLSNLRAVQRWLQQERNIRDLEKHK